MTNFKNKLICLMPAALGLFCLIQGSALANSANEMAQLVGYGLFLPLPGCAYFFWQGCKALSPRLAVPQPIQERAETKLAA